MLDRLRPVQDSSESDKRRQRLRTHLGSESVAKRDPRRRKVIVQRRRFAATARHVLRAVSGLGSSLEVFARELELADQIVVTADSEPRNLPRAVKAMK